MKVFKDLKEVQNVSKPVLTVGTFDGVHIGHQAVIAQLNKIAAQTGGESVLMTFEPHPRIVLKKSMDTLQLLTTLDEKSNLLKKYGLHNLVVQPFTKAFSKLSAGDFIRKLHEKIQVHTIVMGYDHQFGHGREGDFDYLKTLAQKFGFECERIQEIQSCGHPTSSTEIRNALLNGNPELANTLLGWEYCITGKVIQGNQIGRTLGFPTANLKPERFKLIPGDGVYLVKVHLNDEVFKGLLSIGTRPTVTDSGEKRAEVYILNFDLNIYGQNLTVKLRQKIRDDIKFNSTQDLIRQMEKDKIYAENTMI
jgi:riboflavin kinase/FMN adenylyltransferase